MPARRKKFKRLVTLGEYRGTSLPDWGDDALDDWQGDHIAGLGDIEPPFPDELCDWFSEEEEEEGGAAPPEDGARQASHQEAGSSTPLPFPSNMDWREPVPKRIARGFSVIKRNKWKYEELGQEDAYPVYDQAEISSIPDQYNVPLTCRLWCAPDDARAYEEQDKSYVVYLSGLV